MQSKPTRLAAYYLTRQHEWELRQRVGKRIRVHQRTGWNDLFGDHKPPSRLLGFLPIDRDARPSYRELLRRAT